MLPFNSSSTTSFGFDSEPLRHLGAISTRVVPGQLGHRLGQFLQPAIVGESAVVDRGIAAEVDFDSLASTGEGAKARRSWPRPALERTPCRRSSRRAATCARILEIRAMDAAFASRRGQSRSPLDWAGPQSIASISCALLPSYSGAISGCTMLTVPSKARASPQASR